MNGAELRQFNLLVRLYKRDPERVKTLFYDGKLRLANCVINLLYLHFISGNSFNNIAYGKFLPSNCYIFSEDLRNLAVHFL